MTLSEFFGAHPKCALAFSGGADSALLLNEAAAHGADVTAYFVKTEFQPSWELDDALCECARLDMPVRTISLSALSRGDIADNGELRCYYCKQSMMSAVAAAAKADGYDTLIDGTNASDRRDDRPGMRAADELGVLSPLRECGITKEQVRDMLKAHGSPLCAKQSYSCLATRIRRGQRITEDALNRISETESYLFRLGFSDFRARWDDGAITLEISKNNTELLQEKTDEIREYMRIKALPFCISPVKRG